jgi:hypothetical protein
MLDYLTEEVLARQPEPLQAFLLETSVLGGCVGRCARRSPGGPTARGCWSGWSGQPVLMPLDAVRG